MHDVPKGGQLTIDCIILDGNPKPSVSWLVNGKPLKPGYGINFFNEKMEITKADIIHEANYSCVATNINGTASEETQVNVLCMLMSKFFVPLVKSLAIYINVK